MLCRWMLIAVPSVMLACASPAPVVESPGATSDEFARIIRERKAAAARGDSVAWLRAASLNADAVCVDATGRLRTCRPDFGSSTGDWQLHSSIDSVRVSAVDSVVVVTYRQTDTVRVGDEAIQSAFRYVETYRRAGKGWELLALAETHVPPARVAVAANPALHTLFEGTYASGAYVMVVTRVGEHLSIAATGEKPDTMLALSTTRFFVRGDPGEYEFVQTGRGVATELLYRIHGQPLHFRRRGR